MRCPQATGFLAIHPSGVLQLGESCLTRSSKNKHKDYRKFCRIGMCRVFLNNIVLGQAQRLTPITPPLWEVEEVDHSRPAWAT